MNRPKNWYELPYPICESIANDCELEYDSYESSHVEALDNLLCNPTYCRENSKIVQDRYESMTDSDIKKMAKGHIEGLQSRINEIEKMLNSTSDDETSGDEA